MPIELLQDIRLTNVSFIVLGLLSWAQRVTPYDLKQMAASLTDLWSVQHTQLYGEPARLAKAGYLTEEQEATGRRRKTYELTKKGRQALEEWKAAPTDTFTELRDPGLLKLYFGADPSAVAADQLQLHRRKLAEYEAMAAQAPTDAPAGPRLALQAGLGHEREWVGFWETVSQRKPPG
jgi:DNA-binding PadR family transcriptional regulator